MRNKHLLTCMLFIIGILYQTAFPIVSLRVYSKDESLHELNIAKPRFYIKNTGNEPLSDFSCRYYFTTEQNKTPVLEDYYTPDATVELDSIGNGKYYIKFNFAGITINPGQTLPNPDGEVVGLHYTDWSVWDKTNDSSDIGSSEFTLNGNMPVYSSDGTLIYGNEYTEPVIPPQPPAVFTATSDYAVLSKEYTDIRDRVVIKGGNAGSLVYLEAGCDAQINGSVLSGKSMFLRERAKINGNASAGESVNKQNNVIVSGTLRSNAQLDIPQISCTPVVAGSIDITVPDSGSYDLLPGAYKDFHAFSHASVTLHAGTYTFNTFILEPDVAILLKVSNTERLSMNISSQLHIADRTNMSFESGTNIPYSVKIYSAQESDAFIGNDCQIFGNFIIPNAEVHIYSRTQLYGAVYGRKVIIEPDAVICKPPLLEDLAHSQWAYAPAFDPTVLDYKAVVSDTTYALTINASAPSGSIVKINGQNSSFADVPATVSDIPVSVTNADQCGTTIYNLKVSRMNNYQIYVNDNSPCSAVSEDGNSWETAYKDLQQAINRALVEGKEIWVAEGTYKPTKRTDSSDARSATFVLYPGIEIKGGFKGDETSAIPLGSTYKTVLSGDISGNDTLISSWPPSGNELTYLTDNVYHVITIDAASKKSALHISGCTIEGGYANGVSQNSHGAGIYIKNGVPFLEYDIVKNNCATADGAGIYAKNNLKSINSCLFTDNCSFGGNGAGLYINECDSVKIEESVFDRNYDKDTTAFYGGSALYAANSKIELVNSVFTRNNSSSNKGTVFSVAAAIQVINCTFFNNASHDGAFDLCIDSSGTAAIINSILWNSYGKNELSGNGFAVNYTCITNGNSGTGNISADPLFVNAVNPEGADGIYGTADDGLQLQSNSPAIGASDKSFPQFDLLKNYRIVTTDGRSDLGAYGYLPPSTSLENSDAVFGYFNKKDEFVIPDKIKAFEYFDSEWGYILAKNSTRVLYARVLVDNNDVTKKIDGGPVTIYSKDISGNVLFEKKMYMKRSAGEKIRGKLVFYSQYPIMFLKEQDAVSILENTKQDNLYFVYGNANEVKKFEIVAFTRDYR